MRWPWRSKPVVPQEFTGQCWVRETTGDGHFVGRCYYATYDNVCPRHGNVKIWLRQGWNNWPYDHELER